MKWDLARAGWIRAHLPEIDDPARRGLVERFLDLFEAEVVPTADAIAVEARTLMGGR